MNFFAHAVVAMQRLDDPRWLVGSMAPDFASMAGLRLGRSEGEGLVSRGIHFHHQSDDAFHGAPIFIALMKEARIELQRRGLSLGPATAIGHVGVELLLDGSLVEQGGVPLSYRAAIEQAGLLGDSLVFRGDQDQARDRWREACGRLAQAPLPERYQEPDFVAERLIKILSRRPRLAVDAGCEGQVYAWASESAPQVARRMDDLLDQVESRLAEIT